jgi:hypothetical protein
MGGWGSDLDFKTTYTCNDSSRPGSATTLDMKLVEGDKILYDLHLTSKHS